ncbi:hypothetical protein [Corynebacterium ulceribovis]|uniref:hypothetical protein n=1 Tax=Corynebacterium ulceribovis TaxID=487732 RepID=UPI00036E41D8|nr:hypothetical protein [Corynebacterium ulceribovis]
MNDLWAKADAFMEQADGYDPANAPRPTDSLGRPLRVAPSHPLDQAAELMELIDQLEMDGRFDEDAPNRSLRWARWHQLSAERQISAGFPGRATDHLELCAGLYANEGHPQLGAQLYNQAAELYRSFDDQDRARTAMLKALDLEG